MLFDEIERHDLSTATYQARHFEYLNVSARPEATESRKYMEEWFSKYPETEKEEIRARIRSNDDRQFDSAFFELFLFALLTQLGCSFEVHPVMAGDVLKKPDFLVTAPKGDRFYLEATVATDVSDEENAAEARKRVVYDSINKIESRDFFIGMNIEGDPKTSPPGKTIRGFLNKKLKEVDPDKIAEAYEKIGEEAVPKWKYSFEGWDITFFPIPKKPEARGKEGVRPIGMQSSGARWIDSSSSIRTSIEKKASRYGDLEFPYIVAINALGNAVDRESVLEATLGKERVVINTTTLAVERVERDWNGAWIAGGAPKNTRVSGILVAKKVCPWSFLHREMVLYLNPWAQKPYVSDLSQLPRFVPNGGVFEFHEGLSLANIFSKEA